MLIFGVLWRSVLTKAAVALSVVLNRHVHPVLHVKFSLLLLQLALISHMVRTARAGVHGAECVGHAHYLSLVPSFMYAGFPIVVIESSGVGLGRGLWSHLSLYILTLKVLTTGRIDYALDV